ncbi:transposase, partial [Halobacillus trueperi]
MNGSLSRELLKALWKVLKRRKTMLHWFPTPYPDELLYSLFARYHIRSGNTSPKMTTEDLFGKRTVRSVWDLPANLNTLSYRLNSYMDSDQFIDQHTMFPYYAAFLLPWQKRKVKKSMLDLKGSTIHTRIGISASGVKPKKYLWTCTLCMGSDMDRYGETYWRRTHQAPGVFICPTHQTPLEETDRLVKAENQHEYIGASPSIKRKPMNLNTFTQEEVGHLSDIAQYTSNILNGQALQGSANRIRKKYIERLKREDLASLNGFVKRDRVYQSFRSMFSDQLLDVLQSQVVFEEADWLTMIFQKHRKSFHPLRHILILMYLNTELEELFKERYCPFGKGPWLCLNSACESFERSVVTSLSITICSDTRKPVGTFECACGFVYSRRGPDQEAGDRYRVGTIKKYGEVWENTLVKLVNKGVTLKDISLKLNADRETVKKYAARLDLKVYWKPPKNEKRKAEPSIVGTERLEEKKGEWLELQKKYPHKSKTSLRKTAPDVYAFLYRHDRNWLHTYSPLRKQSTPSLRRVDWEERDAELLEGVKELMKNWDCGPEKPTKKTETAIGKKVGKLSWIQKCGDKLPRTMGYIREVEESVESFQKRRVDFALRKSKEEQERIIEWKIYRKAGLRPDV